MADQPFVVQCMYKSHEQFKQHAVLMLNSGYQVDAVNGYRPPVAMDLAVVRSVSGKELDRVFGKAPQEHGVVSVTYRRAGAALSA